jgi:hypothetical protein
MIDQWSTLIPDDLVRAFTESRFPVIFIGSGFGKEAIPALKTGGELEVKLRTDLGVADTGEGLAELLQYLQNKSVGAKREVVSWLKRQLLHGVSEPGGAHRLLLKLPCREFLTTNYDSLFMKASRQIPGYTLTAIDDAGTYESYLAEAKTDEAVLARLHGAFESEDRMVATTDDYINNYATSNKWRDIVQGLLRSRILVFIGYSLRDITTWTSYITILSRWKGNMPPHVMVAPSSSSHIGKFWAQYGVQYVPLKAHQFLIGLHDRLNTLESDKDIAVAAAASCLGKTCETSIEDIKELQRASGYPNLLIAALKIVET